MTQQADESLAGAWLALGALAIFALATTVGLLLGAEHPSATRNLLVASVSLSAVWFWRRRSSALALPSRLCMLVLVATFVPLLVGSLATGDRSWDGLTAFTLRARALNAAGLEHPFFADEAACNYTRHYPLLLPLLLSSFVEISERAGRIVLPALWVLWLAILARGLRPIARGRRELCLCGAALTPIFVGPGHAAVDSGFAELLHAVLLTAGAVALLEAWPFSTKLVAPRGTDSRGLVALAFVAFLLPLSKIEGIGHCLLLLCVAALACAPRVVLATAGAASLGLALQALVLLRNSAGSLDVSATLAVAASAALPFAVVVFALAIRAALRSARLWFVVVAFAIVAVVLASGFDAHSWFREVAGAGFEASSLAEVLARLAFQVVNIKKFGFVWLVFLVLIWIAARDARRQSPRSAAVEATRAARPISLAPCTWLLIAHTVLVVAFLVTRPVDSLSLFVKEGLPRYMAQVIGVAWVAVGLLLERLRFGPEFLPWDQRASQQGEPELDSLPRTRSAA